MPIEKLETHQINQGTNFPISEQLPSQWEIFDKLNEVISIVNKISSLERLEKDLKELGEAFDKVGEENECKKDEVIIHCDNCSSITGLEEELKEYKK
jgi:translation initiation factor IF-2